MHAPSVVSVREDPFAGPDLACSSNRATRVVDPLADGRHQHESSSLQRELPAIGLDADTTWHPLAPSVNWGEPVGV